MKFSIYFVLAIAMLSFGGVATIGAFGEASSERFDKSSEVIRKVAHQDENYAPRTPVITRQFRLDGWGRTRMVVSTSKGDFVVWPDADLSLPSEKQHQPMFVAYDLPFEDESMRDMYVAACRLASDKVVCYRAENAENYKSRVDMAEN